jgi:ribosomal protein L23
MNPEHVIKRPIVLTEKAAVLKDEQNQVIFEVDIKADKVEVRDAVEKLFDVKVESVNTLIQRGKTKRLAGVLTDLNASNKSLLVDDAGNQELRLSVRNMKDSNFLPPEGVNVYDLLRHEHLIVSQEAIKAIEARLLGGNSEVEA